MKSCLSFSLLWSLLLFLPLSCGKDNNGETNHEDNPGPPTPPVVHVQSVSLSHTDVLLHPGEQIQLTATVLPGNATVKTVTWSTSNSDVADVEYGKVFATETGNAVIKAVAESGVSASCSVTVRESENEDFNNGGNGEWN